MSDEQQPAPRDPVKVELVLHDDAAQGPGFGGLFKASFALGLAGAGVAGILASVLGRGLVTWTETPQALARCRGTVEDAVHSAITSFMTVQGVALGGGFLVAFVLAMVKLRQRARRAQAA
jgi:hypothetical protein